MTKALFIFKVRAVLRQMGQIAPNASDDSVYDYAMTIIEWTDQEIAEKGFETAFDAVMICKDAYFRWAQEEAAEYQSIYG